MNASIDSWFRFLSERPDSAAILGLGDSLTAGTGATSAATAYPGKLATLTGRTVLNWGVGGQTSTQIAARYLARLDVNNLIPVFWMGRNNYSDPTTVKADIAACVAHIASRTSRFLVLSILNAASGTENVNSANWTTITTLNGDLAALYPNNYYDLRAYLITQYDPGTPQDVTDHANDVPPSTLRSDTLHLNDAGYSKTSVQVQNLIASKGW